jgi:hypothetical protein
MSWQCWVSMLMKRLESQIALNPCDVAGCGTSAQRHTSGRPFDTIASTWSSTHALTMNSALGRSGRSTLSALTRLPISIRCQVLDLCSLARPFSTCGVARAGHENPLVRDLTEMVYLPGPRLIICEGSPTFRYAPELGRAHEAWSSREACGTKCEESYCC